MKLAVIGSREITAGFALAGTADVMACSDGEESGTALREYASREEIGIILIEKCRADEMTDEIERLMQIRDPYPLIVTIPTYNGDAEEKI